MSTVIAIILIVSVAWLRHRPSLAPKLTSTESLGSPAFLGRYDLSRDEQLGGHTMARHVGRTEAQLKERLAREADISSASTYSDRGAAEKTVTATLGQDHERVEAWLNRSGSHPNLALQFHGREAIGTSIRRGDYKTEQCTDAAVVLRWDGDHAYHVLTTYPEASRGR